MNNIEPLLNKLRAAPLRVRQIKLHDFALDYPRAYFVSVLIAALIGFGYLLLFPLLGIIGLAELFEAAQHSLFDINAVSHAVIWFAIVIFSIAMSHHIFTMKFEPRKGVTLSPDKMPRLFAVIENKKSRIFWPKVSAVLLSEHFELEIYKTPVSAIPLWSKNTLVIGFPVMQLMSQPYFHNILERKLLQYSKGRNLVTNWLNQLQHIWLLYPDGFSHRKLLGEQLIAGFFKYYAPWYKRFSLYMAQQDELAADSIALHHINDSDLFKSIEAQIVCEYFFQKIYLPMLSKVINDKGASAANIQPYSNVYKVFHKTVSPERGKNWLDLFTKKPINTRTKVPTLSQRMRNMGHTKIRLPRFDDSPAAQYYFESHYRTAAQLMDNIWLNKLNNLLKRQRKTARGSNRQAARQSKSQQLMT